MDRSKVVKITDEGIEFDNGAELYYYHEQDCCENHYLSFRNLTLSDFEGLEFDLTNDNFFNRIEDFGIELIPVNGFPIRIPGYGSNNGYYSSNLSLKVKYLNKVKEYNITECQGLEY